MDRTGVFPVQFDRLGLRIPLDIVNHKGSTLQSVFADGS
jgi:hypothetical protein